MIYKVLKNYSAVFTSNYDPSQDPSAGFPTSVEGGGVIPRVREPWLFQWAEPLAHLRQSAFHSSVTHSAFCGALGFVALLGSVLSY